MLRVFSSIRKNLLKENKTLRYLKYAVGEILLVIIGILIALQINNWNQNRLIRVEEREAVAGLLSDLSKDIETLDSRLRNLVSKQSRLKNMILIFSEGEVKDLEAFMGDLLRGTIFGWSQSTTRRSTYDDLLGAGNLGIIKDRGIRVQVSDYYREYELHHIRIDERETHYPNLVYQFVPKVGNSDGENYEWYPEYKPSEEEILLLTKSLLDSPLREHVNAEFNFGYFTTGVTERVQKQAKELKEVLLHYQKKIQN